MPEVGLSTRAQVDRAVVLYAYGLGREAAPFDFGNSSLFSAMGESAGPYTVNQSGGVYSELAEFLDAQQPLETRNDAEAYLDRLAQSGRALDGESEQVRRDAGAGVVPPAYILSNVLGQIGGQLSTDPARSRFVDSLVRRTREKGITGDWRARAEAMVRSSYNPALARQQAVLQTLQGRAGQDGGVWRLRDGESYYAWLLKQGTTTTMTAAEVHQLGVDQNRDLTECMDALLKALGLTQGSVGARMSALAADPMNVFPNTDEGRANEVRYLEGKIAQMRTEMPKVSALGLKAPVQVRRVPVQIQDGAGLGYMNPAPLDGSRPAIYYINLKDTANWPNFDLADLSYHETIPGHAWQFAYLNERKSVPTIRQILSGFNAYVEGWALYSEQLADEIGMYDNDPLGRLGYLQALKFRAVRLVVDTGVHALRWTREQAVDYAVKGTGRARAAMFSEVDRYIATPGQACGYKVGQTEIVRLREKAKAALGPKFNLVGFDDAVITTGPAPLTVLADVIDRWTAARQRA